LEDYRALQKSKRVLEKELNDISEQLKVLVCGLKGFGAWEIR